jgi:biotin carboxylase
VQVNVDGYVHAGRVRIIGMVDEHMYPGTCAFLRFEYPSALASPVQARLAEAAAAAVRAVGLDHGLFNVELVYCPRTGAIRLVEINPRIASQFITLYEWVHGIRLHHAMIDLATGREPRCEPAPQRHAHAASFVYRTFDGRTLRRTPTRADLAEVAARQPDARVMLYVKHGAALAREVKWLGSHRYALLNVPRRDRADVFARQQDVCAMLGFDAGIHAPDPSWGQARSVPPGATDRPHAVQGVSG